MKSRGRRRGFTLVEIMIVIAIIGLLAAMGIPNMLRSGRTARIKRVTNELRTASHAFIIYAMENGDYPLDKTPAQMPDGMDGYLDSFPWTEKTAVGGHWDWDRDVFGITAAVSLQGATWGESRMERIDSILDNGDLNTGAFRKRSGGYMYVIEE